MTNKTEQEMKILVCTWGYSMTLVDFYEVIKETEKTAVVRKLKSEETETGFLCGTSVATTIPATSETMRLYKRGDHMIAYDGGVKLYFSEWDGKPKHYNHCD